MVGTESKDNRDYVRRMLDEVSQQFQQMDLMMERMFQEGTTSPGTTVLGPYYYGYSMTVGPDGKPSVREFGNLRPFGAGQPALGTRELLVDTIVDPKKNVIRVAAEMPGVTKEDVKVSATEESVTISAERGEKKYHAEVKLPAEIKPDSTEANYNNGILELTMRLKAPAKQKGTEIKVE
jgi:HSP20 family protein